MGDMPSTYQKWSRTLREERGLLNGARVQMARELRGMTRSGMGRKLKLTTEEIATREEGWYLWGDNERMGLCYVTDFPLSFFTQEDPLHFEGPTFFGGHDEEGNPWCEIEMGPLP